MGSASFGHVPEGRCGPSQERSVRGAWTQAPGRETVPLGTAAARSSISRLAWGRQVRWPGWQGWDVVDGYLPQSEMNDLIIEIRSQTMGVGFFTWQFDHLQELEGRDAEKIVEARKKALEQH